MSIRLISFLSCICILAVPLGFHRAESATEVRIQQPGAAESVVEIITRPDRVYVETVAGSITPMERVFFHIIIHNISTKPVSVAAVRFDLSNSQGAVLAAQYSGATLMKLFDNAIDRRRIEPTAKQTLILQPDQRKAISDIFLDCPSGFSGDSLTVEVQMESDGKRSSQKASTPLIRTGSFSGRLPFEGTWYVENEHGYLDPHKKFLAEAFAYDFIQIGANGKSYQRDGKSNTDYYAYGKRVLAAKDGTVVFVQTALTENVPGVPNIRTPGGNIVVIDHGDNQYSYYAHLRPNTIPVREGVRVREGDFLGEVGNSGDSPAPQLHFHVMNRPNPEEADGIPTVFTNWKAQSYGIFPLVREGPLAERGICRAVV